MTMDKDRPFDFVERTSLVGIDKTGTRVRNTNGRMRVILSGVDGSLYKREHGRDGLATTGTIGEVCAAS